jgi:hypothetical protein
MNKKMIIIFASLILVFGASALAQESSNEQTSYTPCLPGAFYGGGDISHDFSSEPLVPIPEMEYNGKKEKYVISIYP